ncbi:hypothetical protein Hanom_Chr09g00784231 [Helianthus anomalus]
MGNSEGPMSHGFKVNNDVGDVHVELPQPQVVINEERETPFQNFNVGQGESLFNPGFVHSSPAEECRPSLITVRPKRALNPVVREPANRVPDLNASTDLSMGKSREGGRRMSKTLVLSVPLSRVRIQVKVMVPKISEPDRSLIWKWLIRWPSVPV